MHKIANLSLGNRALVALITLLIAVVGLFSMANLKQELIPSINLPQASVITTAPGMSPQVVDQQVSVPLTKAIQGISGVEDVVASSSSSVSSIRVSFEYGIDQADFQRNLEVAISKVRDALPDGSDPQVIAGSVSDFPVVFFSAYSDSLSATDLTTALSDTVVPRLEKVEGVRQADISGAQTQHVTIEPNAAKLAAAGLTSTAISDAIAANGTLIPAGSIDEDGESLSVQTGVALASINEIKALPLLGGVDPLTGGPEAVTLGDVAKVALVDDAATSITRTNGSPSIAISVTALPNGDTVAISHGVQDALAELETQLPEGTHIVSVFDQAPFIEESIQHLTIEGLLGLGFAVIVILLFLLSVRATIVSALSIPLSVLVAFIGLNVGGFSLNMLTLGALTIAIGRVVDDSIVVIENIKRHLSYGTERIEAIKTGVGEVAGAITASTLTTIMVFVPIGLVSGMVGELFRPFAFTVAIAMLSSLLVALTIIPVLAYWFLGRSRAIDVQQQEQIQSAAEEREHNSLLQRAYRPVLTGTQHHPVITLVSAVVILGITVALLPLMKVDFLGNTGQNSFTVTQTFAPGSDLTTVDEKATKVEKAIQGTDGVESVLLTAGSGGTGILAMMSGGAATATFMVNTDESADQDALQSNVRSAIDALGDDIGQVSLSSSGGMGGFASTVDVQVTAPSESVLADAAEKAFDALKSVSHTTDVTSDLSADQPILQVSVERKKAAEAGLSERTIGGILAGTLSPQSIGSIRMDDTTYDIVIDSGTAPDTLVQLREMKLPSTTSARGYVELADVADVERVTVPTTVTRDTGQLAVTISLTPEDGELGVVTTEVDSVLADLELPRGASATVGGLASLQGDSFNQLGLAMLLAIAIVYLLMVATFKSLIQPLILLVSIPFAAIGAIGLMLIVGKPIGVSALIGMLMLIGIVVTNAIVLIDLVNQYRRQGQNVHDAVFNGARQRLRPILMTALATIFALLPMAIGVTGSSGFISQDLAIVVIGGLVTSTALTLVLIPVLYRLVEGRREKRETRHQDGTGSRD